MLDLASDGLADEDSSASNDERTLNLLVDAMCHTCVADERTHLAVELRNAVDSIKDVGEHNVRSYESDHAHERGPAVSAIVRRLQTLLKSDRQLYRLAGIAGINALITTSTESIHAKIQRTSNAIRVLYNTPVTDIPTARASARLVGELAKLNNPMSDRSVESVLCNAINLIGTGGQSDEPPHPQLSMDRARAIILFAELAGQQKIPNPIFKYQDRLRVDIWLVIQDRDLFVREQGVRGLQAILKALVIRVSKSVAEAAIRDAMDVIRGTLSSAITEDNPNFAPIPKGARDVFAIHGSLAMLASLLRAEETRGFMLAFSSELCNIALPYQTCNEPQVRQAVADILPLLVQLDRTEFAKRFLDTVHTSTLKLIQDDKFPAEERGRSLVSLSDIAEQMPPEIDNSRLLRDMLVESREALKSRPFGQESLQIPQDDVITAISHIAKASRGSPVLEKELRRGLLYDMFETDFTNTLVTAVDEVGRAVPAFAGLIRLRLVHLIAATLLKTLPNRKYGIAGNSLVSIQDEGERRSRRPVSGASVSRTHSFLSLSGPPANPAQQRRGRGPARMTWGTVRKVKGREASKLVRETSARNFFRQAPIAEELHRIDSGMVLAAGSGASNLEGAARGDLHCLPAKSSGRGGGTLALLRNDDDAATDKENSPCVALKAIVNYEFTHMRVADFCSFTNAFVIGYVEYNRVKVRALAVAASAKLMVSAATLWADPENSRRDLHPLSRDVYSKLVEILSIAVADPSTDVRFVAIRSLDHPAFHPYLLQPEVLAKLFICFHDGSLAMRESALSLAGRLSEHNPAHILPALRHYFMHLMTLLRCDGEFFARDRREGTELVYTLVHNATNLVLPYTSALVQALLVRLQEAQQGNDTSSALPVLLTIAEMGGTMSKIDLRPYQTELAPLLVESVLDANGADSLYRKAALRALTAFVQNTGFVIKPYIVHSALLPELLQLLKSESDASVRLLAEVLLGSLGAVDPVDNKYAAIPDYSGRIQSALSDRLPGNGSHSRSVFRRENVTQWGVSAPRLLRQTTCPGGKLSGLLHDGKHQHSNAVIKLGEAGTARARDSTNTRPAGNVKFGAYGSDGRLGLQGGQEVEVSLSLFGLGGTGLSERIAGYCPCWSRDMFPKDSLIAMLDHPFTASPDYFPSVALDSLHKIIGNPRLRLQHREACQAIVNILKSAGPKCSNFLSAVVPRILWLLRHSSSRDSPYTASFTQLQQHVMQRLGDIVTTAGHNFMPFTFDTVLLGWKYLQSSKNSAACITSICGLLSKVRRAIEDEFKPILATVLPPLLSALAQDETPNGIIAKAVLRALEVFGSLLEDYREIVLLSLTRVIMTKRAFVVREEALTTVIRIVRDLQSVEILSGVLHPLLQVLAGATDRSYEQSGWKVPEVGNLSHESKLEWISDEKLAVLAGYAVIEIGSRAARGFEVFVPVVAKALRASDVRKTDKSVYRSLKALLMRSNPVAVGELLSEDLDGELGDDSFSADPEPEVLEELRGTLDGLATPSRTSSFAGLPRGQEGLASHVTRVHVSEPALAAKWDVSLNSRAEDWVNWMDTLGAAMFEQSGSPAFRACARIAESYPPFTKQLFNAVFLSCWSTVLSQPIRSKICDSLEAALSSETIPLNVLQAILNLYEYMDHDEKPLPAGTEKLAPKACKCGAFAKAIRYREEDYGQHLGKPEQMKDDISGEDGLIAIYEKLGHIESAVGTIRHYQDHADDNVQEEWFEKLQRWDDALDVYERTDMLMPDRDRSQAGFSAGDVLYANKRQWGHLLGRLRCLNELGEWQQMNTLLQTTKDACDGNIEALRELSLEGKGASVAFDLGHWDEFKEWVSFIRPDTYDGCFYNTLLSVKRGKNDASYLEEAEKFVHEARCHLDLELTARVSEAYPRAYTHVVNAQLLVELEEMIDFLRMPQSDSVLYGKRRLHELWTERLKGCKQDRFTWYRLLMIRALVMTPIENKDQWLEFVTMCRKTNRLPMASEALRMLLTSFANNNCHDPTSRVGGQESGVLIGVDQWDTTSILGIQDHDIKFACIKHLWATDRRTEAYSALQACRHEFWPESGMVPNNREIMVRANRGGRDTKRVLAGEIFSKLSKWGDRILENGDGQGIRAEDPLHYAERATQIRPDWYKAWHYWGTLNTSRFEALMEQEKRRVALRNKSNNKTWHDSGNIRTLRRGHPGRKYLTEAVRGFFRAIDLEGKSRLEDTLKVLTLWFNYGGYSSLHLEFDKYFSVTNIAMWLEVVPQVIARLYTPVPAIQRGVKALLTRIGKEHPQVAVYPLTVAKTAIGVGHEQRRDAAADILNALKCDHKEIVEQSELVSRELIRSAILWTEMWYERLEEASKFYFVERNVDGMLDTLLPLHAEMETGPETACEEEFVKEFGQELQEAGDLCKRFRAEHGSGTSDEVLSQYLCQAWGLYHHVFRRIQRQQQTMLVFDLAKVSNRLSDATDLKLAVPGTYDPDQGAQVVGIQAFGSQLHVVQSKQRPRKISILGSDGRQYQFLLKGHEDLRQDERVMQVFGLVNKLFAKSTSRGILNGVELKTYAVIALSANAGLIEWVPDSDTMHALVKEYREVRKIMPNIEHKVMLRIAPEPDRLPLLHKVDLFEFMLQNTVSSDIAKVLWLKSRNSEMWLERRNTYARSLATTSMTGYLLGLGDRHPSNLMIERSTGKVLHIDFGDCFEVAMKREKYPEKVPFRLTRMLVQALEPCGVEGYFRYTAEATMDVLRQKNARESLMAMMEAFVYDPLIRWKLIGAEELVQLQEEDANGEAQRTAAGSTGPGPALVLPVGGSGEADPIVTSLRETGSLSASVRQLRRQERMLHEETATDSPAGAVPTPMATVAQVEEDNTDPANLQTPNERARMELLRALRDGDSTNERITHVSKCFYQE